MPTEVEGLRQTVRQLTELGVEVDDLKDVMASIATKVVDVMQSFIPTGPTGKLRASARGNRAKGKAVVTIGRASVKYSGPINYGWPKRNIRPANFTGKTDAEMERIAPQMLEEGIHRLIHEKGLD